MFSASIILRNAREDKELDLMEISKKLKIPLKYLQAIESENRATYPQEPYCSLIIKDYANFLGLNGDDILSLFRRDFASKANNKPVTSQNINLTPHFAFKIGTLGAIAIFAIYLVFEYLKFNRPPLLKISWPESPTNNVLEVSGTTDSESTVRINEDLVIVDSSGNFRKKINIAENEQKIVVQSKSPSGQVSTSEKVYRRQ